MPKRPDISSILVICAALALPAPAVAADSPDWVVSTTDAGPQMTRTIGATTVTYKRPKGDYDALSITVEGCGDVPWSMEEGLDHVTPESLRSALDEVFHNAHLNCALADNLEDSFLPGLKDAFAKVKPVLPTHRAMVGGWELVDEGSQPGDDSERMISMTKTLPTVTMTYSPSAEGASVQVEFKLCDGFNGSSGFDFGNPPEDHVKVVNEQVAETYADFAHSCKAKPEAQAILMQDFPEALSTIEQWLAERPFVYPEDSSSDQEQ